MKIRWTRGSVRFRITPTELESLQRGEAVEECLSLPGGPAWRATIAPAPSPASRLSGDSGALSLSLAAADLARLGDPSAEGVYFAEGDLRYFIEKDFPCVHPRPVEVQETTETFAPPAGFADRHRPG